MGLTPRRKQALGWTLYGLVVAILVTAFADAILFNEDPDEYFNRDRDVVKKEGKTVLQPRGKTQQPTITLEIGRIDVLSRRIDCVLKVARDAGLTIRSVHVMSWECSKLCSEIGPTFDTYFVLPSEEEIFQGRIQDVDHFERKFQFRVSGNPVWYPFDRYRVEAQIFLLNVPPDAPIHPTTRRPIADPIRVTTLVEEFLPEFSMSARKDRLTFQDRVRVPAEPLENTFSFVLVRHRFLRFFTAYIYAIALGFLIYIGFSGSPRELLTGALGYFAALWGIRNVIAGKIEVFPTVVDYVSLLLYSILVLIVVGRLMHLYYTGQSLKNPG